MTVCTATWPVKLRMLSERNLPIAYRILQESMLPHVEAIEYAHMMISTAMDALPSIKCTRNECTEHQIYSQTTQEELQVLKKDHVFKVRRLHTLPARLVALQTQ